MLALIILDGWGISESLEYNAIAQAHTPNWDYWWQYAPTTLLYGSGESVGLPTGQMGNSEVGHMHIGAGRVIKQDYARINDAIANNSWQINLNKLICYSKNNNNIVHIMGLLSDGGIHSHFHHILELIKLLQQNNIYCVVHAFLDGRDTPPRGAEKYLRITEQVLSNKGHIATIMGRYYAMDRDQRWERIDRASQAIVENNAEFTAKSSIEALNLAYQRGESDEFVQPTIINNTKPIKSNHANIFMNFRSDRARQLSQVLIDKCYLFSLTKYSANLATDIIFSAQTINNTIGEVLSNHGIKQLRIAETEKYAHVTFFLNGGVEEKFKYEDRILIPSAKVATYDEKPEMSAYELTEQLIQNIRQQHHQVFIVNFANADMVGHTGDFNATIKAVECLDHCLGKIYKELKQKHGKMLITSDHGNAELMYDKISKQAHTAHTNNPVPFIYLNENYKFNQKTGSLIDIAPTMLHLLGIDKPAEMQGKIL